MKTLKIEKGWFYGAGSMFHWTKDGYDIYGVGVSLDFLWKTTEIQVDIAGKSYVLNTKEAVDFAKKYRTEEVRKGKHLIVVSKSILSPVETLQE